MWNWISRACTPWPACTHSLYVYTTISMGLVHSYSSLPNLKIIFLSLFEKRKREQTRWIDLLVSFVRKLFFSFLASTDFWSAAAAPFSAAQVVVIGKQESKSLKITPAGSKYCFPRDERISISLMKQMLSMKIVALPWTEMKSRRTLNTFLKLLKNVHVWTLKGL